jgi:hypothetical protein
MIHFFMEEAVPFLTVGIIGQIRRSIIQAFAFCRQGLIIPGQDQGCPVDMFLPGIFTGQPDGRTFQGYPNIKSIPDILWGMEGHGVTDGFTFF